MALNADDEILQDFMIEAGEILELLNEQLVDLERSPNDHDLLNAVFRGFHTIKGGAGFLGLDAMVTVCHLSEDVFNLLRNGEIQVTAQLMDTVLPVLDILNAQFAQLRAGEEPEPAQEYLLQELRVLAKPDAAQPAETSVEPQATVAAEIDVVAPSAAEPANIESSSAAVAGMVADDMGDITDEEFEALLDALESPSATQNASESVPTSTTSDDEITEEEFDALLDELHGEGKFTAPVTPETADTAADDIITEEEFDALLDELHGEGKFTTPTVENVAAESLTEANVSKETPQATEAPATAAVQADKPATAKSALTKTAGGGDTANQTETTVRVDTKRLDDIMNMVGELVLVRNRIATLAQGGDISQAREEMGKAVANLDVVTGDLQTSVMKTRMQPIKKVFGRFPRVVRDMSRGMKKEINLVMQGEETDLDKNLVEALADPMVHLVRNAVDHGIEMPDQREKAGKPRQGTLLLAAEQEGDHILLVIEDDGAGMDPEVLKRKAVEKGMMDAETAARLTDSEAFVLIFDAGFSTKTEISDVSGRGVGMDVVRTRISQLNGSVDIQSELGKGTRLSIKVPLTLAIMPTLMIKLREQTFALPLVSVNEIFHLDLTKTNVVDGQLVVMVRGKALPLYYLTRWMVDGCSGITLPESGHVVIVHVGTHLVGFVVDYLIGQEEVVIKPLGNLLYGTMGLAGATITGDGKIALILDVPGLMKSYGHRQA
ncbi:MAG: chemotaxis protein CheA [Thiohalomonadaceae bacterium]